LVRTKPDDGHEWPKHVVLILIFKNIHPLYHTSCVTDYPPTFLKVNMFTVTGFSIWERYRRLSCTYIWAWTVILNLMWLPLNGN